MLVVISALQIFPFPLPYAEHVICSQNRRLFVLRVRKLREEECTCAFISMTTFIKQHSFSCEVDEE